MELAEKIAVLERDLNQLIRKWERFFAGDLKVPPEPDRERMNRRLRMVMDSPGQLRAADRFRLDQLQHRFASYSANWERMLREREEGVRRWTPGKRAGAQEAPSTPPHAPQTRTPEPPRADAHRAGSVHRDEARDLYERWSRAKESLGQEVRLDRSAFEAQIDRQRKAAEAKLGAVVQFDVAVAGGKVKLTARRAEPSADEE